jgi:hypothetical protein
MHTWILLGLLMLGAVVNYGAESSSGDGEVSVMDGGAPPPPPKP